MPREFFRNDRVAAQLRRLLAELVLDLRDANVGDVAVTDVEVSRDLSHAKVFVNVRDETQVKTSITALNKAAGHLRGRLSHAMRMRHVPALKFFHDDALERGSRIDELLAQLRQKQ
ncbi:MAG: ribosome-binding factor A [Lysobacteraceae bacterium]|nr:MAG: ribosome-binding factor A [Xanthomonadaceae bacterium]